MVDWQANGHFLIARVAISSSAGSQTELKTRRLCWQRWVKNWQSALREINDALGNEMIEWRGPREIFERLVSLRLPKRSRAHGRCP